MLPEFMGVVGDIVAGWDATVANAEESEALAITFFQDAVATTVAADAVMMCVNKVSGTFLGSTIARLLVA